MAKPTSKKPAAKKPAAKAEDQSKADPSATVEVAATETKPATNGPAAEASDQSKADQSAATSGETAETKAAAAEATPKPDDKSAMVLAGVITTVSGSFRRLGMRFSKEPVYVAPDYFDPDEIEVLIDEPNLQLSQAEVDPNEVTVLERPEGKPEPEDKE